MTLGLWLLNVLVWVAVFVLGTMGAAMAWPGMKAWIALAVVGLAARNLYWLTCEQPPSRATKP